MPEIIEGIKQGDDGWFDLRRGIPTASNFKRILTPAQLKPSKYGSTSYIRELVAQCYYADETGYTSLHMERGNALEGTARDWYQLSTGNEVKEVSFVYGDDARKFGGSPDGFIGSDGGIEIKCPSAPVHVGYCLEGVVPTEYKPQVFGLLFVTGREWWDFMSYHPDFKRWNLLVRVTASDPDYIEWRDAFAPVLTEFLERLDAAKQEAQRHEAFPERRPSGVFTEAELFAMEKKAARAQAKDAEKNKLLSSFVDTTAANQKP